MKPQEPGSSGSPRRSVQDRRRSWEGAPEPGRLPGSARPGAVILVKAQKVTKSTKRDSEGCIFDHCQNQHQKYKIPEKMAHCIFNFAPKIQNASGEILKDRKKQGNKPFFTQ